MPKHADDDAPPTRAWSTGMRLPRSLEDRARFAIVVIAAAEGYRFVREALHDLQGLLLWPFTTLRTIAETLLGWL